MTWKEVVLGVLLFFVLGAGAGLIGYASNRAEKQEKSNPWLWGVLALFLGALLGFAVVDLIIVLEGGQK